MARTSLETLLARYVADGDERAVAEIVRRTKPRLLAVARRIGSPGDGEDSVQTAYLSLVRSGHADVPVLPWLITAVVRIAYGAKAARAKQLALAGKLSRMPRREAARGAAGAALAEQVARLRQLVDKLPAPYRDPVVLHYFQGIETPEVASLLDLSDAAVRKRLERARALLRGRMGPRVASWLLTVPWLIEDTAAAAVAGGGILMTKKLALACLVLLLGVGVGIMAVAVREGAGEGSRTTASRRPVSPGPTEPAADAAARISGRVRLGPDGRWGAGVVVTVGGRRAVADQAGRFKTEAPAGETLELRAQPHGFERTTLAESPLTEGEQRDIGVLWIQRAGTLVVRVIDAAGAPLRGARVVAGSRAWHQQPNTRLFEATTDAEGRVEIRGIAGATWQVYAFRNGHGAAWREVVLFGGRTEIVLRLGSEHTLRGRVVDDAGVSVTDVTVLGQQGQFVWAGRLPLGVSARVDAEGNYVLRGLAPGDVALFVAWGAWRTHGVATVEVPTVDRYDLVIPRGGTVAGTVRDEEGTPVAGARVYGHTGRWYATVTSGPDGRYRIDRFPAADAASVSAAKRPEYGWHENTPEFPVSAGDAIHLDLVVVRAAALLHGTVVDTHGPLPGALVFVRAGERTGNARTDAHGRFAVRAAGQAPYLVTAAMPGFHHPGMPLDRNEAWNNKTPAEFFVQDDREAVRIVLEPGVVVTGSVVDAQGAPVPHVGVRAQRITKPQPRSTISWYSRFTASGDDGRFRFVLSPRGRFQLGVQDPEWMGRAAGITAEPGVAVRLVATRRRRVRITGVVRDHTGAGVPYMIVRSRIHNATTDTKGRYVLDGVITSGPQIIVAAAGRFEGLGYVRVSVAGVSEVDADIHLAAPRPVSGVVVDAEGRPIAGARVGMRGAGRKPRGELVSFVTGADGRYAFSHAAVWKALRVGKPGYVSAKVRADVDRVVLQRAHEIAGVVRTRDRRPVRGAHVSLSEDATGVTDDQGRFHLHNVPPGAHTLGVHGPQSLPQIAAAAVEGIQAGRKDVVLFVDEAGRIAGRVDGRWTGDLNVHTSAGPLGEVRADGRFRIEAVRLGSHRIELRKHIDGPDDGGEFVVAEIPDVVTGTQGIRFTVDLTGAIRGRVRGDPNDVWILAYPQGVRGGPDTVAAASVDAGGGTFHLTGLARGAYTLWAIVENDEGKHVRVDLGIVARTGDKGLEVRLDKVR